ncbi:hypothetical protein [Natronocalculus amylovorans]|uniref:Uncharacterized protein n=1 Tax=Natronocalculus amylovorans TaxID=2917812 RepID=A0AAE3FUX8_9EURY|nr:hypothetical protein [Natronocalculus amylovorans]MCL9815671.1 hypothetical protein [Natronocalculus amylovorans]
MTTVAVLSHMVDSNTRRKLILTSGVTLGALSGCLGLFDDENGDGNGNGSDPTEQTQDEQGETETETPTEEPSEDDADDDYEDDNGDHEDEDDEDDKDGDEDEKDEEDDEKDKPDVKDGVSIEAVDYDKRKGKVKFKVYNKTGHKVELTWEEYDGDQKGSLNVEKESYDTFWADAHDESLKIVVYFDGKEIDYAEIDIKNFYIESNIRIEAIDYDKHRHKAKFRIYNDTKNDVDVMWKEYNGDQKSHTRVGRNGNRTFWADMKGDSMKLVLYSDDKEIDYAEIDTGDYKKKPDVENEVEIHPDCYDKSDKKATFKIKNATSHHIEVTWKEYGGKHEETVKVRMNDNRHIHVPMKDNGDEMKVVLYFDGKEIDYAELSKDHYCDEYAA